VITLPSGEDEEYQTSDPDRVLRAYAAARGITGEKMLDICAVLDQLGYEWLVEEVG
jgi:hypothetical protein